MDIFTIFVVIVMVVLIFISFKYPTVAYLQTYGKRAGKISQVIYVMAAIAFFLIGVLSVAQLAIFALVIFIDVTLSMKITCYTIAFVVEVIGNLLYIRIRYGGISKLSEVEIVYDDELDDYSDDEEDYYEEEENRNNVIDLEEYRRRKGK